MFDLSKSIVVTTAAAPNFANGAVLPFSANNGGASYVDNTGLQATYRAGQSAFTPLADPVVPFFTIQGSATKVVKVRHIKISWGCTTGNAAVNVMRFRRFTVISGGTPAAVTANPNDTSDPAATAVVQQWTTLPTTATPFNAGVLANEMMQWTTNTATLVGPIPVEWNFGLNASQAMVLRGTSDWFGIEVAAVGTANPLMTIRVEWTEE